MRHLIHPQPSRGPRDAVQFVVQAETVSFLRWAESAQPQDYPPHDSPVREPSICFTSLTIEVCLFQGLHFKGFLIGLGLSELLTSRLDITAIFGTCQVANTVPVKREGTAQKMCMKFSRLISPATGCNEHADELKIRQSTSMPPSSKHLWIEAKDIFAALPSAKQNAKTSKQQLDLGPVQEYQEHRLGSRQVQL